MLTTQGAYSIVKMRVRQVMLLVDDDQRGRVEMNDNINRDNNKSTTLLILAAGMGSRYGGLKQLDPIGPSGEFIIDYSIYDAKRAGFDKVVFIIKEENLSLFRDTVGKRIEKVMDVKYVFQKQDNICDGVRIPEGRKKPWGTAHAVYCAENDVTTNFAVINSDDFYGRDAFRKLHDYLVDAEGGDYCMVGYPLINTVTENGSVSRGICSISGDGRLQGIQEMTKIQHSKTGGLENVEEGRECRLKEDTIVSMNCWGFTQQLFRRIDEELPKFFEANKDNLEKAEFFLPSVVDDAMKEGTCIVDVLKSEDKWFGVTYKEDRPVVVDSIKKLVADGVYPENLWQ